MINWHAEFVQRVEQEQTGVMLLLPGYYASDGRFCRWEGKVDVAERLLVNNQE